jgi:hypothetical protein
MGTNLKIAISLKYYAIILSEIKNYIIPSIIYEPTDSPGCCLAIKTMPFLSARF